MTTTFPRATSTAEIVIPVYGGLRHVRACLDSLRRHTGDMDHRLVVVDDASDTATRETVRHLVAEGWGERGTFLANERNLGFLDTANRGMRACSSDTVVLLNSDTLVPAGWLQGLLDCLYSAEDVGIVSPVSNYSLLTRIDVVYGADYLEVAEAVRQVSDRAYPEIRMATGLCLVARRQLLEDLGHFDELFGRGYFEESDLCLRAEQAGWRTLADDATYVHHHGWGSFGAEERTRLVERNRALFRERWGDAHAETKRRVRAGRPFAELERRVKVSLRGRAQPTPRRPLPQSGSRLVAEKARQQGPSQQRSNRAPTVTRHTLDHWRSIAHRPRRVQDLEKARDVLVLVDDLDINPWATDALQLVDRLLRDGVSASLATSGAFDPALFGDQCRFRPYVLSGPDELADVVPAHRVVLATSPTTVFDALLLRARDGCSIASWFEPQAPAFLLGWPEEGWSLLAAPTLVDAHLVPALPPEGPDDIPVLEIPIGVDTDLYTPTPLEKRPDSALIPHHASAGHDATEDVRQAAIRLDAAGVTVTVYGDPVAGLEARTEPLATQATEAALLQQHAVLVEVAPVPGMERLRLRSAATGTPLVLASPTAASCRLHVGSDAYGAPRGDVARAAELAASVLHRPDEAQDRADNARARVSSLDEEARALARAVSAIAGTV